MTERLIFPFYKLCAKEPAGSSVSLKGGASGLPALVLISQNLLKHLMETRFMPPINRLLPAIFAATIAFPALADIKLITLPVRERVEIQLDHASATLVEEERIDPLAAGVNDVVFAWTNTNVDPSSIQFRCLTDPDAIQVLSVEYPPNQNALVWQVSAPKAGSARIRISYTIGRLNKSFQYRAVASNDESTLSLWQYIELHNQANEAFGEAGMWPGFGERLERPIGVNETRRLMLARFDNLPVKKTYTADYATNGYLDAGKQQLSIPMHYVLTNDAANGLGQYPLKFGKARIFQDDGRGTTAFLGEDWLNFTPRDDEAKLFLGVAKDIVVKRTIARRQQERIAGQLYDFDVIVQYEIENFKDSPVELDIIEDLRALRNELRGDTGRTVEWEFGDDGTLKDQLIAEQSTAERVQFRVNLPARNAEDQSATKITHRLNIIIKNEW